MKGLPSRSEPGIGKLLTWLGIGLLVSGALVGWVVPRVARYIVFGHAFETSLAKSGLDVSGYLGADITALAVIIAVLIGFNASTLQIAGQMHSLALVRAILLSLAPFLICWSITTSVALSYFLIPPVFVAQLWQVLLWFGAVVFLMIGYLWDLPWRLSGRYAVVWAIRELKDQPLDRWESFDGFSVLQTGMTSASMRGDLGTVRSMAMMLGSFLAGQRDPKAEATNTYDRARYRALKNLLAGCAQHATSGTNAIAYYVGFVAAGIILQATAVGHPVASIKRDLFSGLFRILRIAPERLDPLWTGMRHGLCRRGLHGEPYLLKYWREHRRWAVDDPRNVARLAEGIVHLHRHCWHELELAEKQEQASAKQHSTSKIFHSELPPSQPSEETSADMLKDLYRDIAQDLGRELLKGQGGLANTASRVFPLDLLTAIHTSVIQSWPAGHSEKMCTLVSEAYESRRAELAALLADQGQLKQLAI